VLQLEDGISAAVRGRFGELRQRVRLETGRSAELGGAQVILVGVDGTRVTGADPRREAYGSAW
jgi:hypothetical protein